MIIKISKNDSSKDDYWEDLIAITDELLSKKDGDEKETARIKEYKTKAEYMKKLQEKSLNKGKLVGVGSRKENFRILKEIRNLMDLQQSLFNSCKTEDEIKAIIPLFLDLQDKIDEKQMKLRGVIK